MFRAPLGARSIVYLCDSSGSMIPKADLLKRELERAFLALTPTQSFSVIFFHDTAAIASSNELALARPSNKHDVVRFVDDMSFGGTTDPLPGLELAFRQKPQLIYLLTDGDFPDNQAVLDKVHQLCRQRPTRINTIAFVSASDTDTAFIDLLQKIAHDTGGVFRRVRSEDL